MRRGVRVALTTVLALLAAAPAAHAVTVVRDGNVIRVDAAAGEENFVDVFDNGGTLRVTDAATVTAGSGCALVAGGADCGAAATVTSVVVNLGDLDDSLFISVVAPTTADGGPGNDQLVVDHNDDSLAVNDSLTGGSGNDGISAYGGDDTVDGGDGNDDLSGGPGNDSLEGGGGNDSLDDPAGTNTFSGGDGDDSFYGGVGSDQIFGGAGNDNLLAPGRLVGADLLDGGPGTDSARAHAEGEPLSISLDGVANDGIAGQGANLVAVENAAGGDAADTITGSAGPDRLDGGEGADVIDGMGGADGIYGGAEKDSLSGGAGRDFLDGGNGDDVLVGGDGGDHLYGRFGADDMSGGAGRDTVNFGNGSSYDQGASVTLDNVANDGAEGEGDNARSDNENIIGTGGPDILVGGPGPNTITGGEGPDVIVTEDGGPGAASRDHALCGGGEDTVRVDPLDVIGSLEELCENVQYGNLAGWGPDLRITAFGRGVSNEGVLPLELGCPFRARGGCQGTVLLRVKGRRVGRIRFSLDAGETVERSMRLSRRVKRALRRGKVKGTLVSTVTDEIGATKIATKSVTLTP